VIPESWEVELSSVTVGSNLVEMGVIEELVKDTNEVARVVGMGLDRL
jgi:hypothetical protein